MYYNIMYVESKLVVADQIYPYMSTLRHAYADSRHFGISENLRPGNENLRTAPHHPRTSSVKVLLSSVMFSISEYLMMAKKIRTERGSLVKANVHCKWFACSCSTRH